jgi:hypothetical protein
MREHIYLVHASKKTTMAAANLYSFYTKTQFAIPYVPANLPVDLASSGRSLARSQAFAQPPACQMGTRFLRAPNPADGPSDFHRRYGIALPPWSLPYPVYRNPVTAHFSSAVY